MEDACDSIFSSPVLNLSQACCHILRLLHCPWYYVVRTGRDCHSFIGQLLKTAVIQVLLSPQDAEPRHSVFLSKQ